jgi:UDP-N-acetylmuramoyl-tripeptide--D-alanyl-D-alanine ligase
VTDALLSAAALLAWLAALLRWARVAQREHYLPGAAGRFAYRWWTCRPFNAVGWLVGLAGVGLSFHEPLFVLAPTTVTLAGPLGLGVRGRTAPLSWTPRLRRVAAAVAVLTAAVVAGGGASAPVLGLVVLGTPLVVDVALLALRPVESWLSGRFVRDASRRLASVAPTVVAITGSFGKTTTKGYVGQLLAGHTSVLVSPASFNNRLGLARSVNEHLTSGTEVFVAEMGTYGAGEIEALCEWIRPTVSVITAVGPVHLERFGTVEAIAAAKAEIVDGSDVLVVDVDFPELEALAAEQQAYRKVVRCSSRSSPADVYVDEKSTVFLDGRPVGSVADAEAFPGNVACAVGVMAALGLTPDADDLSRLERPPHRRQVATAPSGVIVIDDTYNANPEGADAVLETLRRHAGRRVLVTPGMVELGRRQFQENEAFAERAASIATDVVIVGRTNRHALRSGASRGRSSVMVVDSREQAVEWVRHTLGPGDAVAYENDLPDHFP